MEYSADEIAAARGLQYLAYICTSLATFWAYDYVCSFHEEWNFMCRSRWTECISPRTRTPTNARYWTYVLWNSNRIVLVTMLSTLFATIVSFIGICFSAIATSRVTTSVVPGITGCYRNSTTVEFFMPFLLLLVFQLGLVTLTLTRVFQTWRMSNGGMHAILVKHNIFYYACGLFLSVMNVLAPVMFSDPAYYVLLGESQVYILAILATRMHLHLWHIGQHAVYDPEDLVYISMPDMSSADRTVTTV
ncbi:hypothetical protein DFJ58DRAFT_252154 [Suillus subalutaceus]|uniref:uncharacterized protein n=1 Tax=Suillus subalutaceus TaxID=48586 RepID=UPI001B87BCFA|nr:uncharacterized protein DFJ58DRAFT_252154 [Suillus subalutaceus]KAG1831156.1 hypothetical protein DFJ58DRAFT_252154 [Suillus subalutaceus]